MQLRIFAILTLCAFASPSIATADQLEDILLQNLDPRTFSGRTFDDNSRILAVTGSARLFINKAQGVAMTAQIKRALSDYKLRSFKVLARTDAGVFTSVVYEAEARMKLGRTTIESRVIAHKIWENRSGRWFLFLVPSKSKP